MAFALSKKQALYAQQLQLSPLGLSFKSSLQKVIWSLPLLVRLLVVRLCIEGVLVSIVSILLLTAGVAAILSHMLADHIYGGNLSVFGTVNMSIFIGGVVLLFGIYIVTTILLQIATILGLSQRYQNYSVTALFEISTTKFSGFFLTQVLSFFCIVGGFLAFVLPGIGMMLFFSFVPFIVIFEKKYGMAALQRSISLISQQPLVLMSRLLLMWMIGIGVNMFLVSGFFTFLDSIPFVMLLFSVNVFYGWFSTMYTAMLYKQSSAHIKPPQAAYARVFLVSVSGWVLGLIGGIWMYGILTTTSIMFHPQQANQSYSLPRMPHSIKEI